MKLVYFAPSDIQVARVDRQCIVNFCDAVQSIGVEVELVAIGIRLMEGETQAEHPLDLYRIRKPFPVRIVRVPVHQKSSEWWLALNRLRVHSAQAIRVLLSRSASKPVVLYTKNYGPALAFLLLKQFLRRRGIVVFEAHMPPRTSLHKFLLKHSDRVVANTQALANELVKSGSVAPKNVIGTHQGVDLELIEESRLSREEARQMLSLPLDKELVVYTGKIYSGYKEVEYLLDAARQLRHREDIEFLFVGGRVDHVERYRAMVAEERLTNVHFVGFVPPSQVQYYQFAADVLLLYYPSGMEINRFRSPGKLFEYMAASRPIISVDLPVLREVLGDHDPAAVLVPQDSPLLLAEAIADLLADPARGEELARRAFERVHAFTWKERGRVIVRFLGGQLSEQESGSVEMLVPSNYLSAKPS